jgi:glucose/arabinose dehydrogenase/plastocyanin
MLKSRWSMSVFALMFILIFGTFSSSQITYGAYSKAPPSPTGPVINDPRLTVEKVTDGLRSPTSMAFLGPNDILVTEKNTGTVVEIRDGKIQPNPVLDVDVASATERGLLGIALSAQSEGRIYVFIYYTESGGGKDGDDYTANVDPAGNRLYRYEYVNGELVNPVRLLDLPATPQNLKGEHIGGKVLIGPDNNVYLGIGEVGAHRTEAQNVNGGPAADGTGGILRITQDGHVVPGGNMLGGDLPLSIYYAVGIRNSFGMDFDPITGNLWDTENGPALADEINMVKQGFNSGWAQIQGYAKDNVLNNDASEKDLVTLGNSQYGDPKFVFNTPIGLTDAKFLNSDKLGKEYANNLFAGDINNGHLYRLNLNENRDGFSINNTTYSGDLTMLSDSKVDSPKESEPIIFGQGFGGITDLEVGPDGYLYVLTYPGSLYRVMPSSESSAPQNTPAAAAQSIPPGAPADAIQAKILGIQGKFSYSPEPIEIRAGQAITWYNDDAISHTVTSGSDADPNPGAEFDSNAIISKQSFSLIFDGTGDYDYYCIYHPSMVGTIHVR